MKTKKLIPVIIELLGIALVGAGIGIELIMHADFGLVIITTGSCFIAIGGVIWGKFVKRGW